MEQQVSNTDKVPENDVQEAVFDENASSDFFESLDQNVNGGIQNET